ncbi:MAG TPA: NADP-dependent oxidoreductase [Solirubrobacteraceae bacterium]|nr:NADP-dependent oxidoreductase [Solirubrobacteraceae bacterium]
MRAAGFDRFGGPEVLRIFEVDEPHPSAGQLRIAVRAAGVNPVDSKIRRGLMGGDLPRRTGVEAAGVVDELGEGVRGVSIGDRVFGPTVGGAAAERALLTHWALIPASLDFAGAAGLPVAVETATRMLELAAVREGETVVVNGASGAVGLSTVQLARARGARVIGTAGPANQELVRSFGAEPTTYGEGLAERVRKLAGGPVDACLDAAGGGALPELVALAGGPERVVTIADYEGAQRTGARFTGGSGEARAWHALAEVAAMIDQGRFRLPVAHAFPLERIADAHALSESGHPGGKIVLTLG